MPKYRYTLAGPDGSVSVDIEAHDYHSAMVAAQKDRYERNCAARVGADAEPSRWKWRIFEGPRRIFTPEELAAAKRRAEERRAWLREHMAKQENTSG